MPQKNQKSITLHKDVYAVAEKEAKAHGKSVAKHVTDLIQTNSKEA